MSGKSAALLGALPLRAFQAATPACLGGEFVLVVSCSIFPLPVRYTLPLYAKGLARSNRPKLLSSGAVLSGLAGGWCAKGLAIESCS
jgi:hypothetical protein